MLESEIAERIYKLDEFKTKIEFEIQKVVKVRESYKSASEYRNKSLVFDFEILF